MVRFASCLVLVLTFANPTLVAGQDPPPPPVPPLVAIQPSPTPTPQPPPQPGRQTPSIQVAPVPPPGKEPARKPTRDINVHVEITISDQIGSGAPEKKVVSMTVAEGSFGRIRASADAQAPAPAPTSGIGLVGTELNVDARPWVLEGDRIRLELTLEYAPIREGTKVSQRPTKLNESITVVLQNGKPMVISQAADPVADRKMVLEARATVAK